MGQLSPRRWLQAGEALRQTSEVRQKRMEEEL